MPSRISAMFLSFFLIAWASVAPAQRVYKWTDAQGVTHYTDQAPATGKGTTFLQMKAEVASPVTKSQAAAATPTGSSLENAEAAARVRNCERSKANLATLSSGAMLVDSTDPGAARRLDAAQVAAAKRTAETDVASYCGATDK